MDLAIHSHQVAVGTDMHAAVKDLAGRSASLGKSAQHKMYTERARKLLHASEDLALTSYACVRLEYPHGPRELVVFVRRKQCKIFG